MYVAQHERYTLTLQEELYAHKNSTSINKCVDAGKKRDRPLATMNANFRRKIHAWFVYYAHTATDNKNHYFYVVVPAAAAASVKLKNL